VTGGFPGLRLLGKAEWLNPGGSVKDRAAARIVLEARRSGRLGAGRRLLDATSGNTGVAYAMLGAALGFGVTLCVPANASPERFRLLRAYGAEVILTDPGEGSDGAILRARQLAAADPERWFYADQYSNPENWRAHYLGTGDEIWRQTHGRITHFVAMLGTSGTFVGTSRRLKELNPAVRCVSLQPDAPFHGVEGAKHMGSALVPPIYDPSLADEDLAVSTEAAQEMARRLARRAGLLVGVSAGGAVAGSLEVARRLGGVPAVIVTVLCDSGARYLSERFWEEE
jgi:cysteine synthase B